MKSFEYSLAVCIALAPHVAFGGVGSSAIKGIARKLTGEAAEATAKTAAKKLGTEALEATAKEAAKAAARRAASAATQQFGKAVVANAPRFADDFAIATARLTSRNGRRLAMMAPKLAESGQAPEVVARLTTGNADELIETLWKHREKVGAAAIVTGLLIHGDDVVNAGGEFVAKPVIEGTMDHVVAPTSRLLVSGIVLTFLIGMFALAAYLFGGEATDRVMSRVRGIAQLFGCRW